MRRTRRFSLIALPVVLPAALLVAAAAVAFWSAERTLGRSAAVARTQHQLAFTLGPFLASEAGSPAFIPVASADTATSGTVLQGVMYLAGPSGLAAYSPTGELRYRLRTGVELPVAPIAAIASGRLRGHSDAEVLVATSGAGVLMLAERPHGAPMLQQLLPGDPRLADLTTLLPTSSGDLLLGTRHAGVLLFDGATLSQLRPGGGGAAEAASLSNLDVTALASLDAASVLIGTRNAGVFYLHAGTVEHADASAGLPDDAVESIAIAAGRAFVGTPLGVAVFDLTHSAAGSFRSSEVVARGHFSHALALFAAPGSGRPELLVGTLDEGVQEVVLDPRAGSYRGKTTGRLRNTSLPISAEAPSLAGEGPRIDGFVASSAEPGAVYAIADGVLLARTGTGWTPALAIANAAAPEVAQAGAHGVGLTDRNISALRFAPDGRLFVGYFDRGLDILNLGGEDVRREDLRGGKVSGDTAPRHLENDHLFCVNRLALDPQHGTMAAATANGLVLFDAQGNPHQVLTRADGLISDHVTDVIFTPSGMTLATPAGLTFLGPGGVESVYAFQGLVNNHVYALGSRAGSDDLLAGTLGGLSILQSGVVRRNLTVNNSGLKHNWITAIAAAPDGSWMVGTYGAGVLRMRGDGNSFTRAELPSGIPDNLVINPNALLVTGSNIFAGTLDHGMLIYNLAEGHWSAVSRGLPSLNVTAFAERDGVLYVGTANGLVRIAEQNLTRFAGGLPR